MNDKIKLMLWYIFGYIIFGVCLIIGITFIIASILNIIPNENANILQLKETISRLYMWGGLGWLTAAYLHYIFSLKNSRK